MRRWIQGSCFDIEWFYVKSRQGVKIYLHALNSMITLLMPFLKDVSARELGIGKKDDVGYIQCPDPGTPYTDGGTVIFEMRRVKLE